MKLSEYLKLDETPTAPAGDSDEAIVLDYRARIKALQDIQSDTEIIKDPDLKQAVLVGRAFLAKWRDAWINAEPGRGMLFNKMRFESEVEEGNVKGKGEWMPHLGKHSGEQERIEKLQKQKARQREKYMTAKKIARKNTARMNPEEVGVEEGHTTLPPIDTERYTERKGLEGPFRAKNAKVVYYDPKEGQYYDPDTDIYISNDDWEAMNEGFDTEKYEGVVNDVWFTGDDGEESGGELTYTAYLDSATGQYRVDPNSLDGNIDQTNNPGRIPDDSVRDFMDSEFEDYVAMAQEHADEHAGERDNKYAHGESVEDDGVSNALDAMRQNFHDYNHDQSDRWEKYNHYRNDRRQISQRAKSLK